MTKTKYEILDQVFSPISPIEEVSFFFGRKNQLEKVRDAINEKGQHAILYGDRGVGKTSLANIMVRSYTNLYSIKITCDRSDNFKTLWERIFEKIIFQENKLELGFKNEIKKEVHNLKYRISSIQEFTPNVLVDIINSLGNDIKFLFILDEFDNIRDIDTRAAFADLIKSLSDNNKNSTILLVGIADSVEELIGEHQSLERCLKQVKMPRMKKEECEEIINNGLNELEISMDNGIKNKIIDFSSGFPHYIHLLCKYGCEELIENSRDTFTEAYLQIAIKKGIDNTAEQLRSSFRKGVLTANKSDKWRNVIYSCCLCEIDEFNSFTISDINDKYTKLTGKQSDIKYNLSKLTQDERGEILVKLGKGKSTKYAFRNPMMRAFVKLKMNSNVQRN